VRVEPEASAGAVALGHHVPQPRRRIRVEAGGGLVKGARFLVEEGGAMVVGADNLSFETFRPRWKATTCRSTPTCSRRRPDPEETFAALTSSPQSCRPELRDSES